MDLTSKSIGLALSGGGSKGLAHAGALKFLEEKTFDQIGLPEQVQEQLWEQCMLGGKPPTKY